MLGNFESSIFVRKYIFHFPSLIRMVFGNRSIAYSRALSIAFKAQKKITFQFEYLPALIYFSLELLKACLNRMERKKDLEKLKIRG